MLCKPRPAETVQQSLIYYNHLNVTITSHAWKTRSFKSLDVNKVSIEGTLSSIE